ncbi:MAG TPA: hypothetical protein PKV16_05610 [Caldisericia bacterium]|nr:hypothetical protein [Caldisericia bacterium]HPF48789.1 hypothetical protein [Caldisericia bacterium]HPI83551.1 hypothetical protein [Caldisericia bacterium]HPQ93244.1 hypothetical protein [Caldisericia bacterium]HRV74923.1 hypothetical protein [Caldisericia bacterium]
MPDKFFKWAFEGRAKLVESMRGGNINPDKMFIEFTRHTPVMITNGPAGLNGSVKGFGFAPVEEYLDECIEALEEHTKSGDTGYESRGIGLLLDIFYSPDVWNRVDKERLFSLELAKKHTWENITEGSTETTLVYYQPPAVSFELRGKIDVAVSGKYFKFVNLMHDAYHKQKQPTSKPTYIFSIEEVFDNSVGVFGQKLL